MRESLIFQFFFFILKILLEVLHIDAVIKGVHEAYLFGDSDMKE